MNQKHGKNKWNHIRLHTLPKVSLLLPVTIIMVGLVAVPLIYIIAISFCKKGIYGGITFSLTLENYKALLDPMYLQVFGSSFLLAAVTTIFCILIGYPFAYLICKKSKFKQAICMMLIIVPFWTSSLIRTYGWMTILKTEGIINKFLLAIKVIDQPLQILYTNTAVVIGMIYILFPFMVMPLVSSIGKLDHSLLEASKDLGAKPWKSFFTVTLPLTAPGIFAGSIMVFIPTLGYFFIPDLLGGSNMLLIGNLIKNQFNTARNWPLGAALSVFLIVMTLVIIKIYKASGGELEDIGI